MCKVRSGRPILIPFVSEAQAGRNPPEASSREGVRSLRRAIAVHAKTPQIQIHRALFCPFFQWHFFLGQGRATERAVAGPNESPTSWLHPFHYEDTTFICTHKHIHERAVDPFLPFSLSLLVASRNNLCCCAGL